MLALFNVLVSVSSLLLPTQDTTPPTVTGQLECPQNQFVVTVDNPGDLTYQIDVDVLVQGSSLATTSATVGPGAVVEIPITLEELPDPVDIVVTGDNGLEQTTFPVVFGCADRIDLTVTTPESTPVVIDLPGPCFPHQPDPVHGTVEPVDQFRASYAPDPGYVGTDSFDYECVASAGAFGTVFITVTKVAATSVPPATLPVTGPRSSTSAMATIGVGLMGVGLLLVYAERRRSSA